MGYPRRLIVDREHSGYYHCMSRCVRQAYLCGDGFDHRKDWIHGRLELLADVFAIDVVAYGILSNHTHVVLRTHPERVSEWAPREVAERWLRIFGAAARTPKPTRPDARAVDALAGQTGRIKLFRERLGDLSWFMRCLNEPIARWANAEENRHGRFWEGRFKSQALLDWKAVLACCAYVDLNPIRAGMATTPETSDHTSVQERIRTRQAYERQSRPAPPAPEDAASARARRAKKRRPSRPPRRTATLRHPEDGLWLVPIQRRPDQRRDGICDMTVDHYLKMVEDTGRAAVEGKGSISAQARPLLDRLGVDPARWLDAMSSPRRLIGTAVGTAANLAAEAARRGAQRVIGALHVYPDRT